jgi:hypothetical protein
MNCTCSTHDSENYVQNICRKHVNNKNGGQIWWVINTKGVKSKLNKPLKQNNNSKILINL